MSDPNPHQPATDTEPKASAAETQPAKPASNATADAASSTTAQRAPVDVARGDSAPEESRDDSSTGDTAATGFAAMGLAPAVARAVAELGYEAPTSIQASCIPPLLEGRDLLGQAQTGTGKTAAFALPLLSRLDTDAKLPQLLVLAPTRELALQVAEACQGYAQHMKRFQVVPIYGGQSYTLQIRQLKHSPQVIVGTPGRVMDHMRRGTLSLDGLGAVVLDEADEMLNMGFAEDIDWIFEHIPATCQVALFSATMPQGIAQVARKRLKNPVEVRIEAGAQNVDAIDQSHCVVTRHHKLDVLTRILEMEPFDGMVIFVRTKNATTELADKLKAHGFAAEPLNGDMTQEMRERTVERLRRGRLDIVVATDVAARGLDVERVTHVVNYDIPNDPQTYVHRIGRTGRAGRKGRAILLVEPRERGLLRAIERTFRCPVPQMEPPSAEQLTNSRIDRFTGELRKTLTDKDLDFFYRLVTNIARDQELEPMDIAAALAFQLQRERPLEVEELPRPPQRREGPDQRGRPRGDDRGRPQGNWRDRGERPDRRPPGGDDRRGPPREQRRGRDDSDLVGYRIEVGHDHGVTPREIVGAIANEAGIEGRYIGRIDIRGDHSTVDLPSGMPKEMLHHLKRVYVRGQALRITELGQGGGNDRPPRHFKARDNGPGEQRPRGNSGGGYSDRGPGQGRGGYSKDRGPRDR